MNFFIRILNIGMSDIENFQDTEILNLLSSKISFEALKSILQWKVERSMMLSTIFSKNIARLYIIASKQ